MKAAVRKTYPNSTSANRNVPMHQRPPQPNSRAVSNSAFSGSKIDAEHRQLRNHQNGLYNTRRSAPLPNAPANRSVPMRPRQPQPNSRAVSNSAFSDAKIGAEHRQLRNHQNAPNHRSGSRSGSTMLVSYERPASSNAGPRYRVQTSSSGRPSVLVAPVVTADLETGLMETCLVAAGRSFVKIGQGMKQTGLELAERTNFVERGTVTRYTQRINDEASLYYSTPVARSRTGRVAELTTDIGLALAVPGGAGVRGIKLVLSSGSMGALWGGLQATDGLLSTRLVNAAKGFGFGAAGGAIATHVLPKVVDAILGKKLSALQKAQITAVKTENLSDGRIRYYESERASRISGPTRGASFVTEYNPKTGQVRSWNECYDHKGKINRIHPKTIDGQDLQAQHYPPTEAELNGLSHFKPKGLNS